MSLSCQKIYFHTEKNIWLKIDKPENSDYINVYQLKFRLFQLEF